MLESRSLLFRALLSVVLASTKLCLGQAPVDTICNNTNLVQCDQCISASPLCSWCPITPEEHERLRELDIIKERKYVNIRCRDERTFPVSLSCANISSSFLHGSQQNPQTVLNNIEDRELSTDADGPQITQVRPQRVAIKLRRGDTQSFNMKFISLRNTPLDVYFLVDVSASLQQTINTLRRDIATIAESLRLISSGFAIGFGSFVDKRTLPYAPDNLLRFTDETQTATRCRAFGQCEPPYVYHHSISLTNDVIHFQNILGNVSQLSGNLDTPEASLDALMQTAVCSQEIGWRDDALKMVFLFTDQSYHFAGDGKLAGLVQPNSGKCGLARIPGNVFNEFEYTRGLEEDYVSVWQLRSALEAERIVPIFVIQYDGRGSLSNVLRETLLNTYQGFIDGLDTIRARVRAFDSFSNANSNSFNDLLNRSISTVTNNLINIIQTAYSETVQTVQVSQPRNAMGYRFEINPVGICRRGNDTPVGACVVDFDNTVNFSVSVTLEDCRQARNISVQLIGGPYQFTMIELEPLCTCPCTDEQQHITDDSVCTGGQGDQVCGVCNCNGSFTGPECQCSETANFCNTSAQCGGFECNACGFCECNDTRFGSNCQCGINDGTCPLGTNPNTTMMEQCSGTERGICNCETERCECKRAPLSNLKYFGQGGTARNSAAGDNNCACDPDNCYNSEFEGVCYDQVVGLPRTELCGCDGCICNAPSFAYRRTCTNADLLCAQLTRCVQCFLNEPCTDKPCTVMGCGRACLNHTIDQLNANEVFSDVEANYQDMCELTVDGCVAQFYFSISDSVSPSILLENSNDYSCPAPTLPWIIAGSLVGAILLLGLLALIILKICLVFLERLEYRKFTQELKEADFAPHENPLYITPQQDYQNPLRRNSSRRT